MAGSFISNHPSITVGLAVVATIFGCLRIFGMTLVIHEGRNVASDTMYPCPVCKAGMDHPCTEFTTI